MRLRNHFKATVTSAQWFSAFLKDKGSHFELSSDEYKRIHSNIRFLRIVKIIVELCFV